MDTLYIWYSVEDRLPPLDKIVLAFDGANYFTAKLWKSEYGELFDSIVCTCCNPEIQEISYWAFFPLLEFIND